MNRETIALILASACYLGGFFYALNALRRGAWRPAWWKQGLLAGGLGAQTLFLWWRGQATGGCPISTPFELLTFVSWAMVVFYFVVGPAYRLSMLGVCTSPLAFLFQAVALLRPEAWLPPAARTTYGLRAELHAALSLMAYGAFGLACAAGVMFLVEDRWLKEHRVSAVLRALPPIHHLTRAIRGLILTGVALLTAGIGCALGMESPSSPGKLTMVWIVWGFYVALAIYDWQRGMSARRAAWAAAAGFIVPVLSLWVVGR